MSYLGHIISEAGVGTDPSKIDDVKKWQSPINVKQLRQFLGLAGYYRKFVRHFGIVARPLTNLLRKGVQYTWTSVHEEAFQTLKAGLVSAPVLALPNFELPFVIETDACEKGIGAVLQQAGHPIAFLSKSLVPKNARVVNL